MKSWKKISCLALFLCVICLVALLIISSCKECCLCTATAHSLCLVDLESGKFLDLTLDGPPDTYVHGFETAPSNVDTFSLIRFGSVTGSKCTSPACIELKIPMTDKVDTPTLCRNCKKLLPKSYKSRYALVDFGSNSYKQIWPITGNIELCISGYQVTIATSSDAYSMNLIIAGTGQ